MLTYDTTRTEVDARVRMLLDGGYARRIDGAAVAYIDETHQIADGAAEEDAEDRRATFRRQLESAIGDLYGHMTAASMFDHRELGHGLAASLCEGSADLRDAVTMAAAGARALGIIDEHLPRWLEGYLSRQYEQLKQLDAQTKKLRTLAEHDTSILETVCYWNAREEELTQTHLDLVVNVFAACVPMTFAAEGEERHEVALRRLENALDRGYSGSDYVFVLRRSAYLVLVSREHDHD